MLDTRTHWENVYETKATDRVSWFSPHLERSLAFVEAAQLKPSDAILDVGGGASTLVDDLLERQYRNVSVLDISEQALQKARLRLGERASQVTWLAADITRVELPSASVAFWHDRAVFHFLRDAEDRQRYINTVRRVVRPGGYVIISTFGLEGPERCSGLEVMRYDAEGIHHTFGAGFTKLGSDMETHLTPWGSTQQFVYCFCRVTPENI